MQRRDGPERGKCRRRHLRRHFPFAVLALGFLPACSAARESVESDQVQNPVVYGEDDRREFYDIEDAPLRARVEQSTAVLMPRDSVSLGDPVSLHAPSLGDQLLLCPGEPYADQPAAAFCTAVLVDWDLVLTAGHCLHAFPRDTLKFVFGDYYDSPDHLAITAEDVFDVADVVLERIDRADVEPRLDYAFVRLSRSVGPSRAPAPVRGTPLASDDVLTFAGSPGGVPAKIVANGRVVDAGAPAFARFVANTDTSHGSSGGAAFDKTLAVAGVLMRGAPDYVRTDVSDPGCVSTARRADEEAAEEFVYAAHALDALCRVEPDATSLCRKDCGEPCQALPRRSADGDAGCSLSRRSGRRDAWLFALLLFGATRRWGSRGGRTRSSPTSCA